MGGASTPATVSYTVRRGDTLSDIARDPSDRGLIAVLITHGYRPVIARYEKLLDE